MIRILPPIALVLLESAAVPSPPEWALLAEINRVRADPTGYAAELRTYRSYFRGRIVRYPGNPDGLITSEGTKAVDEAIAFLQRQHPLPPLSGSELLASAAEDHVSEQGPRGATGHLSADGSNPARRVERRGGGSYVAETITYGPPTAAEVVRQLIVDDGVPSRGHRRILFAGEFRYAGAACGPHKVYRVMCVVDFGRTASGRYDNDEAPAGRG